MIVLSIVLFNVFDKDVNITLKLLGSSEITIPLNDNYQDQGFIAYDQDSKDLSKYVNMKTNLNTNKAGIYNYIYTLNYKGIKLYATRIIKVIENFSFDVNVLSNGEYTNQDIIVNIKSSGTFFSHIILPDGTITSLKDINYTITNNGDYKFIGVDKNDEKIEKVININNIDKNVDDFTCTINKKFNQLEYSVNANDRISGIDYYIYGNNTKSYLNTFISSNINDSLKVTVYDKAGNRLEKNCSLVNKELEIHFIAGVSDDDVILIRDNDKTIMVDGGQWDGRFKAVEYLKGLGVKHIDAMIGSHVHWNHVQAQAYILDNMEVDNLYYSVDILNCVSLGHCKTDDNKYIKAKIIEKNKKPVILKAGDKLEFGDIKLYFIGPTRGQLTTYENANSLVFILEYGKKRFLFTGDTPSDYMNTTKFLQYASNFNMDINVDLFKWPHHGYETLTDDFFSKTTPEYAIIPNCCSCTSTSPNSTNRNLLNKYNTKYYQVCDSKNIVVLSDGNDIRVKTLQKAADYFRPSN